VVFPFPSFQPFLYFFLAPIQVFLDPLQDLKNWKPGTNPTSPDIWNAWEVENRE